MAEPKKILMVIMEHEDENALQDMVENIRYFCPNVDIAFYNSGDNPNLGKQLDVIHHPNPKRFYYAKIVTWFIEVFEWVSKENLQYDYLINMETDLLFIRKGYEAFVEKMMQGHDYMAPNLQRNIAKTSKWRPYRSLKPELKNWFKFWEFDGAHGAFSPAQVFSRRYIEQLLNHPKYPKLQELLKENKSFTLQEVLFPTLPDMLGLKARSYPDHLNPIIRYRPYQATSGIERALDTPDAFFAHPIRREQDNKARLMVKELAG